MRNTTKKAEVSISYLPLRVSALQDAVPWAERLCACHAAQLPQSIPHGHSNQSTEEQISSFSSGNTEACLWDGNCYYRGDESRDFEGEIL